MKNTPAIPEFPIASTPFKSYPPRGSPTPLPMIFNPIRKELFTDSGEFIKKLHCPYRERWESMTPLDSTSRLCSRCDHAVVDTSAVSDDDLIEILRQHPNTCLKVDLNQQNLIVDIHARRPS